MKLTEPEIQREMDYLREERLGILCGKAVPEPWMIEMAEKDAVEWRKRYEDSQRAEQGELL